MLSDELNSVSKAGEILREAKKYKFQTLNEIKQGTIPELKTTVLDVMYKTLSAGRRK